MARKRRTRKDKETVKHTFTISWDPSTSERKNRRSVKGQSKKSKRGQAKNNAQSKNAKGKAKAGIDKKLRKDILKSLALAGIILCLEIVLYLIWPS
jgi:hypothetical protein